MAAWSKHRYIVRKSNNVWASVLKESGKVIGHMKIYPDENHGKFSERNSAKLITYALSECYWGKGYMTEVVKRVVKYAFDEMNI
ncbi:MAG: GNAT family N-acetyltransferase [Clostridiales bacterium]|nr:GNAT family N-acetyltransferase [Clostridiales bacterium]